MLKMKEGTVKSRLFRAREALKKCLKKALGDL
jgi:DNA-directed RNA polymerase specialized sigma24 family protein